MCDICDSGLQNYTTNGRLAATNTTTNTQTEVIQTGLQCGTRYYIRVVVTGEPRYQGAPVEQILLSNQVQVLELLCVHEMVHGYAITHAIMFPK